MSDPDRGAYTPQTDAPLAFDARQSRRGGGGGSPTALIVSGIVLVLLIVAVVIFYRGGVRGANEPPQPVGAPIGAVKTPAPPAPKTDDPTAALDVYKSGDAPAAAGATTPAFAPPPEKPMPRPTARPTLRVETSELPPPSGPPLAVGPARPEPVTATPPQIPVKPATAAKPPAAPATAATPAPAAAKGAAMVQIGAFSSEALADKGWGEVAAAFPGDMAGKGRRTELVQTGGGSLHRGLITGFSTREAAAAFCGKLKAAGRQCIVK